MPYILRYCWGVEVATFHHVLRSPWPWFHQVSAPSLQGFIRIWSCYYCSILTFVPCPQAASRGNLFGNGCIQHDQVSFYTVASPLEDFSYLPGQPSGATPWRNGSCCLTPTRAQLGPKSQKFLSTGLYWGRALLGYYLYCVQVVVALRADLGGDVEDLAMVTSVLAVVHIKDNICPIPTQVRY